LAISIQEAAKIAKANTNDNRQQTLYSTRATLEILDDATTMQRDAFRDRLERFLRQNGFQI
jgi:hypothetical protein